MSGRRTPDSLKTETALIDIKQQNRNRVIQYIYAGREVQQQMITEDLGLSRPTVIQIIRELQKDGIIYKNGYFESTGGRKAEIIHFAAQEKLTIGIELIAEAYEIAVVDLYGNVLHSERLPCTFANDENYYARVCLDVLNFLKKFGIAQEKIIGAGIVLQGLISADGENVTYGKILNCTGLRTDAFTRWLPFECKFYHDAESAAQKELWDSVKDQNMIYMNLRSHVSGAVIVNREFLKGTELKSGVFEHMTLVRNGRSCYCGRKGCMDAYCSTRPFIEKSGSLELFFEKLRQGEKEEKKLWREYLQYLAMSINNLHMFIDYPVVLGGTIARYLKEEDLVLLHWMVNNQSAFPSETRFIRISNCPHSPICRGAALSYIRGYLQELADIRI